jgi:hypothetical protein
MVVEYWLGASSSGSCADTGARVIVQEGARRGSPWGERREGPACVVRPGRERPRAGGARGPGGELTGASSVGALLAGDLGACSRAVCSKHVRPGRHGASMRTPVALPPTGHLFAGAVAGAVSRTATAPLETLRLAAMAGGLPAGARLDAMATALVSEHGWQALYKGERRRAGGPGAAGCRPLQAVSGTAVVGLLVLCRHVGRKGVLPARCPVTPAPPPSQPQATPST